VTALFQRKPKPDPEKPGKVKLAPDVPPDVDERMRRGQARLAELAPGRNECWEFFRNNTYTIRTKENQLVVTASGVSTRGGDPPHRVKTRRPVLMPFVRHEVSSITRRMPGYQVVPTNIDPETVQAAKASEKILRYGYEKWGIDEASEDWVQSSIIADESFAWPYWDDTLGPVLGEDEHGPLYQGEICIRIYTGNEVTWEPGVRFKDSQWWVIQQARPVDDVLAQPGCLVSELAADATDKTVIGSGKPTSNTKLVLVQEYFERPSDKHRRGRRVVKANGKRIMPVMDYPLLDQQGRVVNEPFLIDLSVLRDKDSDHDHGLVKYVLDAIRSYQEAVNKQLQFSKHMLPQMVVPPGTQVPFDDTPMAVFEHPRPEQIKFREIQQMPTSLDDIADRALTDVARAFSQNEIPSQVEAGRAIQALIDNDETARQAFIKRYAGRQALLASRCLVLVCLYYDTSRLINVVGDFGTEVLPGFKGSDLMGQTQVRVLPQSIESQTREAVKQDVTLYAQLQWIGPEDGIQAIKDGTTDNIGADFEYDRGRAYEIIQKIKQGPAVLFAMPTEFRDVEVPVTDPMGMPVPDPMTGQPLTRTQMVEVPGWMPREVDNVAIHKAIFARWMKSAEWGMLDPGMREAARLYWRALDEEEQKRMMQRQALQSAQASGHGAANAAKNPVEPMPSLPNPSSEQNPEPA
jgi:hypothetical protein